MKLKHALFLFGATLALLAGRPAALAQNSAFTYQGRLNDSTGPATGIYDLRFTIYNAVENGTAAAGALTNAAMSVSNGLFTATLDFGAGVFSGADLWLEIGVRTNGSASDFTALAPRQPLTATPYAVRAANATSFSGAVSDVQLSGNVARLNGNQSFSGNVNFSSASNSFAGSFTGNGTGVTNVNLITADAAGAITWATTTNFTGRFVTDSSPGVGSVPFSVAAADVNGDGKADLISANLFGNTLSVLTNNGHGRFVLASSPAVGSRPQSVGAAEFNGDGRMDLLSANSDDGTVSVLINNGSGGFARTDYSVPGVAAVATADVNGDGKADWIAVGRTFNFNFVSVFTNDAGGGFVDAFGSAVGDNPESVTVTDVNGDGRVDLITANRSGHTLTVLTNNGGSWFLSASPAVGNQPVSVVAALPISRWHFTNEPGTAHVGPMAQDFHAAFGLGTDERHIATVDADGVALAAIQGLNQKLEEKETRLTTLEKELAEIKRLLLKKSEKKE